MNSRSRGNNTQKYFVILQGLDFVSLDKLVCAFVYGEHVEQRVKQYMVYEHMDVICFQQRIRNVLTSLR